MSEGRILTEGYVQKGGINPQGSFDSRPPAPSAMKPLEDELTHLREQVEMLREALAPFSKVIDAQGYDGEDRRLIRVKGRAGNEAYRDAWIALENTKGD